MTSRLTREDANWLYLSQYVHANNDEYSDWMLDEKGNPKYPEGLLVNADSAAYEIRLDFKVNKFPPYEVVIEGFNA